MVSTSPAFDSFCYATPTCSEHRLFSFSFYHRLVVRYEQQRFGVGESKSCGACFFDFEYEFVCDCAAADESAGDWVWRDGVPAAEAAAVTAAVAGTEEWVG